MTMSDPMDQPPSGSDSDSESLRQAANAIRDLVKNDSAVAKAMMSMRQSLDEMGRLSKFSLPRVDLGISSHWAKTFEEQTRHWREITQPFEKIRTGLWIENEFARVAASQHAKLSEPFMAYKKMSESLRDSVKSIQGSMAAASASQKLLLGGLSEAQQMRLDELAKPFQLANSFTASLLSETLKLSLGKLEIAEHFKLPALDPIATAAITQLLGEGDLQERIRSISVEMERALQEREAAEQAIPSAEGERQKTGKQHIPSIDFWTLFSIILTLVIFAYQERGSSQMEARLSEKIENGDAAIQAQIKGLQDLLVQAMSAKQSWEMGQTQFVVRSRVARIRRAPASGSPKIAEVFPNQVVAMLGERGKWIHVEYYDWLAGEKRQGWALKKYFVRVRPVEPGLTGSED